MKKHHEIDNVIVTDESLTLRIDGEEYSFPWAAISPRLLAAAPADRARFEISPSGYGIHWPDIDEDLSSTVFWTFAASRCSMGNEPRFDSRLELTTFTA